MQGLHSHPEVHSHPVCGPQSHLQFVAENAGVLAESHTFHSLYSALDVRIHYIVT